MLICLSMFIRSLYVWDHSQYVYMVSVCLYGFSMFICSKYVYTASVCVYGLKYVYTVSVCLYALSLCIQSQYVYSVSNMFIRSQYVYTVSVCLYDLSMFLQSQYVYTVKVSSLHSKCSRFMHSSDPICWVWACFHKTTVAIYTEKICFILNDYDMKSDPSDVPATTKPLFHLF